MKIRKAVFDFMVFGQAVVFAALLAFGCLACAGESIVLKDYVLDSGSFRDAAKLVEQKMKSQHPDINFAIELDERPIDPRFSGPIDFDSGDQAARVTAVFDRIELKELCRYLAMGARGLGFDYEETVSSDNPHVKVVFRTVHGASLIVPMRHSKGWGPHQVIDGVHHQMEMDKSLYSIDELVSVVAEGASVTILRDPDIEKACREVAVKIPEGRYRMLTLLKLMVKTLEAYVDTDLVLYSPNGSYPHMSDAQIIGIGAKDKGRTNAVDMLKHSIAGLFPELEKMSKEAEVLKFVETKYFDQMGIGGRIFYEVDLGGIILISDGNARRRVRNTTRYLRGAFADTKATFEAVVDPKSGAVELKEAARDQKKP